jgi:phenylpyruvate tautomerase PptA (4-oxalocrotonate tautomerase family)
MPLYTITTQAGVLSGETKATLARELTAFHSEYASVPKNWVHIVFQEYPRETASPRVSRRRQWRSRCLSALAGRRNTSAGY